MTVRRTLLCDLPYVLDGANRKKYSIRMHSEAFTLSAHFDELAVDSVLGVLYLMANDGNTLAFWCVSKVELEEHGDHTIIRIFTNPIEDSQKYIYEVRAD